MLFGPYDVESEIAIGEAGILTWTGSKGRRYNTTYAEQEGPGRALEVISAQLDADGQRRYIRGSPGAARDATTVDRMNALIFAQTYQTSGLASMRDVLERWGMTITVDLDAATANVLTRQPTRLASGCCPCFRLAYRPAPALLVNVGADGLPASQATHTSARTAPLPLTLPVDRDAYQAQIPDVWNRPGMYRNRRIVAARQSLGFGIEVLYESHPALLALDPTIYLPEVTAEDFAVQLAENERWRLQNTAQSFRVRQALPYWDATLADELTLQPLDLVSLDGVAMRVESVEHEWSAGTGYLRTLNCWLWQGYFEARYARKCGLFRAPHLHTVIGTVIAVRHTFAPSFPHSSSAALVRSRFPCCDTRGAACKVAFCIAVICLADCAAMSPIVISSFSSWRRTGRSVIGRVRPGCCSWRRGRPCGDALRGVGCTPGYPPAWRRWALAVTSIRELGHRRSQVGSHVADVVALGAEW